MPTGRLHLVQSPLLCIECRNRTGNVFKFSAAFGCRTSKRADCLRHADRWHRKELGYHSVPTLLTKETEKVKQNRVRTIFRVAVPFLAVEKIPAVGLMSSSISGLLLLKTAGNRPPIRLGLKLSWAAGRPAAAGALRVQVGGGERGK